MSYASWWTKVREFPQPYDEGHVTIILMDLSKVGMCPYECDTDLDTTDDPPFVVGAIRGKLLPCPHMAECPIMGFKESMVLHKVNCDTQEEADHEYEAACSALEEFTPIMDTISQLRALVEEINGGKSIHD